MSFNQMSTYQSKTFETDSTIKIQDWRNFERNFIGFRKNILDFEELLHYEVND